MVARLAATVHSPIFVLDCANCRDTVSPCCSLIAVVHYFPFCFDAFDEKLLFTFTVFPTLVLRGSACRSLSTLSAKKLAVATQQLHAALLPYFLAACRAIAHPLSFAIIE